MKPRTSQSPRQQLLILACNEITRNSKTQLYLLMASGSGLNYGSEYSGSEPRDFGAGRLGFPGYCTSPPFRPECARLSHRSCVFHNAGAFCFPSMNPALSPPTASPAESIMERESIPSRAKTRLRVAAACDECRAKKVKCDGISPGTY